MAEVIVVIHSMPVSKVPIKRTSIAKTLEALNTSVDPLAASLLAMLQHFEKTTSCHHLHDIVRLLHSPELYGTPFIVPEIAG